MIRIVICISFIWALQSAAPTPSPMPAWRGCSTAEATILRDGNTCSIKIQSDDSGTTVSRRQKAPLADAHFGGVCSTYQSEMANYCQDSERFTVHFHGPCDHTNPFQTSSSCGSSESKDNFCALPLRVCDLFSGHEGSGFVVYESVWSTWSAKTLLKHAIDTDFDLEYEFEVVHSENAPSPIPYNNAIFFNSGALDVSLLQANQMIGLELPTKVHLWKQGNRNYVKYQTPEYLMERFSMRDSEHHFKTLGMKLMKLAMAGSGAGAHLLDQEPVVGKPPSGFNANTHNGVIRKESSRTVKETLDEFVSVLPSAIRVVKRINFREFAEDYGQSLRDTELLIIGNPALGSPIMEDTPSSGFDLPQKILSWENANGTVYIGYNDPQYFAARHNIDPNLPQLITIANALDLLSNEAL